MIRFYIKYKILCEYIYIHTYIYISIIYRYKGKINNHNLMRTKCYFVKRKKKN